MPETNEQEREIRLNVQEVARSAVDLYAETLLDIQDTLLDHPEYDEHLLAKLKDGATFLYKTLQSETSSVTVKRRIVRPEDNIEEGEHPGVAIKIEYANGNVMYINIYGGIGREQREADIRDTDIHLRRGHAKTTEELLSKPTQFNINIHDENGMSIFDSWTIVSTREGRERASITSLSFINPKNQKIQTERNVHISLQDALDTSGLQKNTFTQISKRVNDLKPKLVALTPPPQS